MTAYPDVTTHEVTEDDEFLVIACDGKSPEILHSWALKRSSFQREKKNKKI